MNKKILFSIIAILCFFLLLETFCQLWVSFVAFPVQDSKGFSAKKVILPPKKQNELRIFTYGGSTVWGEPHPALGFVPQTQFYLNMINSGKKIKIFNFAAAGQPSQYVYNMLVQTIYNNSPDLIIILSGHNEFFYPSIKFRKIVIKLKDTFTFFKILHYYLSPYYEKLCKIKQKELFKSHSEYKSLNKKIDIYYENMDKIVRATQKENIPLFLCTVPYNMLWPPVYYKNIGSKNKYDKTIRQLRELIDNKETIKARDIIQNLLRQDESNPMLTYLLGKVYYAQGNYKEASNYLTIAKDLDNQRIRVLSIFNTIIRKIAQRSGVYLVDIEKTFKNQNRSKIIGFDLIADNCHPTPLGNYLIAKDIIEAMVKNKIILHSIATPAYACQLEVFLDNIGFLEKKSRIKRDYLLNSARFCLSLEPILINYRFARMYLEQAVILDKNNWKIWANLSTTSFLDEKIDQGIVELKKAMQLKGTEFDVERERETPYLKAALRRMGLELKDISEPL